MESAVHSRCVRVPALGMPRVRLLLLVATALGLLLAPSASARATNVRVPNVTGMSLGRAERTLRAAGLATEGGERLEVVARDRRHPEFTAPSRAGVAKVTAQSIPAHRSSRSGALVALATSGRPGPHGELQPMQWSAIVFAAGRVVLRGLERWGDCMNYDHAEIGPATAGVRTITVWARDFGRLKRACERPPSAFVVHPGPDWTAATIGVERMPSTPDPSLTGRQAIVKTTVMLEPDHQTLIANYGHGACDDVAGATAALDGTVSVVIGSTPGFDGACDDILLFDSVLIRLPAPVPPATVFHDAPCHPVGAPATAQDPLPCYE
jgi:hypothetical protein